MVKFFISDHINGVPLYNIKFYNNYHGSVFTSSVYVESLFFLFSFDSFI